MPIAETKDAFPLDGGICDREKGRGGKQKEE